jgi:hypothetical protein
MVPGGVVCPLFQTVTGEHIPVQGLDKATYPIGTELQLEGTLVRRSSCQQGKQTLRLSHIIAVNGITQADALASPQASSEVPVP